jgi:Ca2+-binding RTX toxin-like protein
LTVAPQGTGAGTVTGPVPGPPPNVDCAWNGSTASGTCEADISDFPTTVELTAAPTGGSTFAGWTAATCPGGTISGTGDTVCSVTVDDPSDDIAVQPVFQGPDTVATLTVAPQGDGGGSVVGTSPGGVTVVTCTWSGTGATGDCSEEIATGQGGQFVLVATADTGSTVAWTNCPGTVSADGRTCTLTIDDPADDFTVRPAFTRSPGPPGCTVAGTDGDDVLMGTSGQDVICGLGGNDTIRGLGGNDVVQGGAGNDRLFGGSGGDQLNGGAGNDRIESGVGNDRGSGGAGADRVYGDAGTDSMSGGAGADRLFGGGGSDAASGGAGADWLYGGTGSDVLSGGLDFDRAFGNAGADLCSAERKTSC